MDDKNYLRRMSEPAIQRVMMKYETIYNLVGLEGLIQLTGVKMFWEVRLKERKKKPYGTMCSCEVCSFLIREADNEEL